MPAAHTPFAPYLRRWRGRLLPDLLAALAVMALPIGALLYVLWIEKPSPYLDNPMSVALMRLLAVASLVCWLPAAWVWLRGLGPVARVCSPAFRADLAVTGRRAGEVWRGETEAPLWRAKLPLVPFALVALAPGFLIGPCEGWGLNWYSDFEHAKLGVGVVATMVSTVVVARLALVGLAVVCCRRSRPLGNGGLVVASVAALVALPIAASIIGTALFFVGGLAQVPIGWLGIGWRGCCPMTTWGDLVATTAGFGVLLAGLGYAALGPAMALGTALDSSLFRFDSASIDPEPPPVAPSVTEAGGFLLATKRLILVAATLALVVVMLFALVRMGLHGGNKLSVEFLSWMTTATVGLILLAGLDWRRRLQAPSRLRMSPGGAIRQWAREAWPITLPLVVGGLLPPAMVVLAMAVDLRPWIQPSSDDVSFLLVSVAIEVLAILTTALICLVDSLAPARWYRAPMAVLLPVGGWMMMATVMAPDMIAMFVFPTGLIASRGPQLWPATMGVLVLALAWALWRVARLWAGAWRARRSTLGPLPDPPPPYPEYTVIRRFAAMPDNA